MESKTSRWTKKDWLGLGVIPLELFLGIFVVKLPWMEAYPVVSAVFSWLIFVVGFFVMIYLFKDFLKSQWQLYRQKLWKRLGINALLTVGVFVLLALTRTILPKPLAAGADFNMNTSIGLMFLASIPPFIAPFSEELTFRYLLFGKIHPKVFKIVMFFVSSILFGLIHWQNFGGNWLLTIPYMVIGAYFALIYHFFDNIWGSIMTHWMFNTINSIIPVIFMLILKIFGVEIN